jgi:hypothetical protein
MLEKGSSLGLFNPDCQSAHFVDRDNLSWWLPRSSDPSDKPKIRFSSAESSTSSQGKRGGWLNPNFKINQKDEDGQMNESLLISFEEAGRLLGGLHPNTLRQRKAGTENLTHVTGFGRRVMLLREEVDALVELKIAQAHAAERDRRKILRLAS